MLDIWYPEEEYRDRDRHARAKALEIAAAIIGERGSVDYVLREAEKLYNFLMGIVDIKVDSGYARG